MGTLREDITEIKVGVATLVEHVKNVDNQLLEGESRFNDHSKVIRKHDSELIKIEVDCKESKKILGNHSKMFWWVITQGTLTLLTIIGFLAKIVWEYVKTKGLPTP